MRPPEAAGIPVQIVTGFLGAGKTTLIRRLIAMPDFAGSLLLVNEIGDIGLDRDILAEQADMAPILLKNGCVCCVLNDDLGLALRDVALRLTDGDLPPIRRVVIETTGLADPGPILRRILADRWLMQRFTLAPLITVIGADDDPAARISEPEAVAQLAHADIVAISKADLAGAAAVAGLAALVAAANPTARLMEISSPALDAASFASAQADRLIADERPDCHAHPLPIHTASLRFDARPTWASLAAALDRALARHGNDVLRVKGIVGVVERDAPIVIDAVRRVFHAPRPLVAWPADDRSSRLVAIGRSEAVSLLLSDVAASLDVAPTIAAQPPRAGQPV